ncbi:signal peptidase II [Roseovarius salis]|uniref:signal peptidase II n=1 Tax=Roseovarius salis TaxID=3376063 RepID=UPI0037C7F094
MRVIFWVGLVTFLVDQASKNWVLHRLNLDRVGAIDVWPPYLNLRMAWNHGINFGLFAGDGPLTRWVLIAIALVISAGVLWWVRHEPGGTWQKIAAGLLVGGALGNVVDRVLYGAVADFLNMSCCGIDNPYAFNVADIAVFAGALGMIMFSGGKKPA